jgi:iron complex outermembrane receptor protein
VVVTAAPYAVSLDTVTSSVNVVTRDQLDTCRPAGIGDLLNGLPGLRSTFYGPGASRPVIRGLSGPRVMVLQNGVGQVDASALSPDHAVASDPGEASRIEVLRGPSTLAYGGSGIGGVVNMIDDRVPSSPAANGPEGRLSASASSVDDGWAYSGAVKAGKGPIVFAADISSRRTDDYSIPTAAVSDRLAARDGLTVDPDHVVKNTDVEVDAYGAGVSYVHDRGFFGASVKKTDTTYGVPYEQILAPIDPKRRGPGLDPPAADPLRPARRAGAGQSVVREGPRLAGLRRLRARRGQRRGRRGRHPLPVARDRGPGGAGAPRA